VHLLRYVVICTVTDSPLNTQSSCLKCPPSVRINFLTRVTRELVTWQALQRCSCFLQRWEFSGGVLLSCSPYVHSPQLSCKHTHGNLMGSDPVTVVANSVHRHDQSTGLGIHDSDTAWRPDCNEAALCHADSTSVVVFVQEHSLRVMAVRLARSWRKYHLSDVVGKCTDQGVGDQWHHTTRLWESDVGSCFRQFHVDYHDPINGSFLYCWLHRGYNEPLHLQLLQTTQPLQIGPMCTYTVWHFWLRISSGIKSWNTDLNSESLANITHKRNVSVPYPVNAAYWTCGHV
jgi:hypothetical protein